MIRASWQDLVARRQLFFEQQPGLQVAELQFFLVCTGVFVGSFERAYQVSWVLLGSNPFGIGAAVVPGRNGQVNHCLGLFPKLERIDRGLIGYIQSRAVLEPNLTRQEPY